MHYACHSAVYAILNKYWHYFFSCLEVPVQVTYLCFFQNYLKGRFMQNGCFPTLKNCSFTWSSSPVMLWKKRLAALWEREINSMSSSFYIMHKWCSDVFLAYVQLFAWVIIFKQKYIIITFLAFLKIIEWEHSLFF